MEDKHAAHAIPFGIEDPIPIMFLDPLEFILAMIFAGFGIILDMFIFGFSGAILVVMGAKYLKRGAKKGAMQHYLWGLGLNLDTALSKKFAPSWVNDMVE